MPEESIQKNEPYEWQGEQFWFYDLVPGQRFSISYYGGLVTVDGRAQGNDRDGKVKIEILSISDPSAQLKAEIQPGARLSFDGKTGLGSRDPSDIFLKHAQTTDPRGVKFYI